jgi:hypothetical protein
LFRIFAYLFICFIHLHIFNSKYRFKILNSSRINKMFPSVCVFGFRIFASKQSDILFGTSFCLRILFRIIRFEVLSPHPPKKSKAHCLLPTHCLMPTVYWPLPAVYGPLSVAYFTNTKKCLLSIAHCLLPTAPCVLHTVYCPLPTVHCPLYCPRFTAHCLLTVYCLLPTVYHSMLSVYCPPSTAHSLLPTVH